MKTSSAFRPWGVACATVATLACSLLTGCIAGDYNGNCTTQTLVKNGSSTGTPNFSVISPGGTTLALYPGQTATLPITVGSVNGSSGTVALSVDGLPSGVTVAPVTATIGTPTALTFVSTQALAAECFAGITQIFTANSVLAVKGSGAGGSQAIGVNLEIGLENPAFVPAATYLPTVTIATTGAAAVTSEDDYLDGTMTIVDPASTKNAYTGTMEIKGHGTSTWIMPKKPYRIKLDSKSKLLGMSSEKNWILLANYDDKTMLRDALASEIGNIAGVPWAPNSVFVELTLNGQYEGVYQLIENVDINSNRVNIADSDTDVTDPTANGYVLEIDQRQSNTYNWITPHGIYIGSDDPDPPTTAEGTYITALANQAEASFYASDAASTTTGWRTKWDENSVIDWFLVNELMGNQDSDAYSSDYFYKDAGASPFVMGPIWDFDISSGNDNYGTIGNPTVPWVRLNHPWYAQLFKDPTFLADVKTRWTAIRPQIGTLNAYLTTNSATLSKASVNNYARWTTLYQRVWPNNQAAGTYSGEITFLQDWMTKRIAYMDANYLNN